MFIIPTKELIVFDLEFTHGEVAYSNNRQPYLIEIGAVRINSTFDIIDSYQTLVRPPELEEIDIQFIEGFNKISIAELEKARSFKGVWKEFAKFTRYQSLNLCSWNIFKDYAVLEAEYMRNKQGFPHCHVPIDAISIYWTLCGINGTKFKGGLNEACRRNEVEIKDAHRALPDAVRVVKLLKVLFKMKEEKSDFSLMEF